jgi:WD40 repeat protein
VSGRERRQNKVRWQNTEVNDEITAVDFHPSRDNLLLSGADDGAVCIFDTHIEEEQDSLLQAVNHSPIHKAGFFGPTDLYALSSDQILSLHSLTVDDASEGAGQVTPPPDQLGDLRPAIPCEYVIDVLQSGPDQLVACGSHRYVLQLSLTSTPSHHATAALAWILSRLSEARVSALTSASPSEVPMAKRLSGLCT